jgi:hypothetical protein
VIDKLEITVDPEIPLSAEFESEFQQMRKLPHDLYKEKASIRAHGVNAILLRHCRFNATHKLSMVRSSEMTLDQTATFIENIFDCDPWALRLSRVDFAIDLSGLSMDWVRAHIRVPRKRWKDERGFTEGPTGRKQGRTLYLGSTADLFRFYDKGIHLARRLPPTSSAQQLQTNNSLTRIERQLRTGRIPSDISTLSKLRDNGSAFDPFAPLYIACGGKGEPKMVNYSAREVLEGTGFRRLVERDGFAKTWDLLNALSRGNARRFVRRAADFIPPDPVGFQLPDFFEMHLDGLRRQLA